MEYRKRIYYTGERTIVRLCQTTTLGPTSHRATRELARFILKAGCDIGATCR